MNEFPVIQTRRKGRSSTQRMLIPTEAMVAEEIRAVPAGSRSGPGAIRRKLAAKYGADACCPVTLQRHLVSLSQSDSAPFWRVVDADRPFARCVAGGPDRIREKLAEESGNE